MAWLPDPDETDDWERVEPGRVPGGFLLRITAAGRILGERQLTLALAGSDVEVASNGAKQHGEARVFIYDGDTGECVKTIVVEST